MGNILNHIHVINPNDDVINPDTGLTGKQKKIIQSTWITISKDSATSGAAIMLALLKKYPEYQKLFTAFSNIPIDDLKNNPKFRAHGSGIINALSSAINSLDDSELLAAKLTMLGERHATRGQTKEQFNDLKPIILEVLKESLGSKFTSEVSEAWSKLIDGAYTFIFKGFPK
ncbi:cytoglobin-1 [Cephus cinctus]|uniref:Cytoglobin-1 n=1 Tax=Cephus cinctus TaxID=211228 RepID=A0AAJ7W3Y6_CEPCN|nr:cytoglobin-1 [Cephus cinctus]